MIDCNEWRTEKRHECTNMGKVKRLELWWQLYRTSLPVWDLENLRPMDFCWHECTYSSTHSHPSIAEFKKLILKRIYSKWRDGGVCVNVNGHQWWAVVNTVMDTSRSVMAALILTILLLWRYTVWSCINLAEIKTGLLPKFHPEDGSSIFLRNCKLTIGYKAIVVTIMMNLFR